MAKKKEKPVPLPCKCGRTPVAAKGKGRGWIVACPSNKGCTFNPIGGGFATEEEAVKAWNEEVTKE